MLPSHIVGSIIAKDRARPFVLRVDRGLVQLGRFTTVCPEQAELTSLERAAVGRQVRMAAGKHVQRVVIGEYQCPSCQRWVDVVRDSDAWADDCCAGCD
jgi:hypothetical protein